MGRHQVYTKYTRKLWFSQTRLYYVKLVGHDMTVFRQFATYLDLVYVLYMSYLYLLHVPTISDICPIYIN